MTTLEDTQPIVAEQTPAGIAPSDDAAAAGAGGKGLTWAKLAVKPVEEQSASSSTDAVANVKDLEASPIPPTSDSTPQITNSFAPPTPAKSERWAEMTDDEPIPTEVSIAKDSQMESEKEDKAFVPAPPPSVNIWKVRMQEQKKTPSAAVSSNTTIAPETVKEERPKKHSHKERSKKEKEVKEHKEVKAEKVEQEEDKDAAEGFVKVQSKKATRGGSAATQGRGQKGGKGAQGAAPVTAAALSEKQAAGGKKKGAVADKPASPVPADKPAGDKSAASGAAAKSVKAEDESSGKKSAELRSGPAKIVNVAARSENLLKDSSPSSQVVQLHSWPTLGSEPPASPTTNSPTSASPAPSASDDSSRPASGSKKAWAKLDVPIRYTPPASVAARGRSAKSGKGRDVGDVSTDGSRSVDGDASAHSAGAKGGRRGGRYAGRPSRPPVSVVPVSEGQASTESRPRSGSIASVASNVSANNAAPLPSQESASESLPAATLAEVPSSEQQQSEQQASLPAVQPVPARPHGQHSLHGQRRGGGGGMRSARGRLTGMGGRGRYVGYGYGNGFQPQPQSMQYVQNQGYNSYGFNGAPVDPEMVDLDTLRWWIRLQVEYYFSIDNLCHDIFFRRQMNPLDGTVPLSLITNFNRVKTLITHAKSKAQAAIAPVAVVEAKADDTTATADATAAEAVSAPAGPLAEDVEKPAWTMSLVTAALNGSEVVEILIDTQGQPNVRRRDGWE
ncbi:La- protein 4, partial [Rhizophlyctis rosea]